MEEQQVVVEEQQDLEIIGVIAEEQKITLLESNQFERSCSAFPIVGHCWTIEASLAAAEPLLSLAYLSNP